ncbi:MAG: hypothetical protein H7Y11_10855 [Armatimonadetes bacterium]|nr:hypothetical protein [Anaerolineae bacterium]
MPIHRMSLEGDIFVAKAVGYLEDPDLRLWANALRNYAESGSVPLGAVMDMAEVNRVAPTAAKVLGELLKSPNVGGVGIIISDAMLTQNAKIVDKMSELNGVRMFSNWDEALRFVQARLTVPVTMGGWGTMNVSQFSSRSFASAY